MGATTVMASLGARALTTRWIARGPIRLYQAGLGFLLSFGTLGGWVAWVAASLQFVALLLLALTVPRR